MLPKPSKCCAMGSYDCQVPMPLKGRLQSVDYCIADIVAALNAANIITIASCCGHGNENHSSILLEDGRELNIKNIFNNTNKGVVMQAYLGTKIILAESMDDIAFGRQHKDTTPADNQLAVSGYRVQYSNPDGSKYDSWSPKDVFERAYRKVSDDEIGLMLQGEDIENSEPKFSVGAKTISEIEVPPPNLPALAPIFEMEYLTDDLILPKLKLQKPCKMRVKITDADVCLYIGPRDWQWDRKTGKLIGTSTSCS